MVTLFCTAGRSALSVMLLVRAMVSPLFAVLMQVAKAPAVPALHVAASLAVGPSAMQTAALTSAVLERSTLWVRVRWRSTRAVSAPSPASSNEPIDVPVIHPQVPR
jgi:hypothetical protein